MNQKPQALFARRNPDPALVIKQRLLEQGLSVTALAKRLKRSRRATSVAIHHPQRYPRLRSRIEEVLGAR